ncbi:MAG: TOBE domain-containing protein, partial [Alphaproteobacteria bacterium]|nr:TOBE domain-containing protein [Alphaproteobacteria bacterium]
SLGTTSIYVTHDQVEAMTMADRLVVMNGGRAEQIGTPMEVYERPATVFVAGFIGSPAMNFLEGRAEGGKVVVNGAAGLAAPADIPDGPVLVGLRPEHLAVVDGGAAMLELAAEAVEPLGADTLVHGRLDDGQLVTIRFSGTPTFGEGDRIALAAEAANLHFFDPETGRRI